MLKVWIVGSEGQIGEAINEMLNPLEIEALNTDKNELDITQTDEVLRFGEIKIATALFFIMIPPEFSIFEFLSASYFFGLV